MSYRTRMLRKRMLQVVAPPLARLIRRVLYRLSWTQTQRFGAAFGRAVRHLSPHRLRFACSNLRIVLGEGPSDKELHALGVEVFASTGRLVMESLRLPAMSAEELAAIAPFEGIEHLDRALEAGQGAVIVTAHMGNWEIMGTRLAQSGYRLVGLSRASSSERIAEVVHEVRRDLHVETIPVEGGIRPCLRVLGQNKVLGMFPDRRARGQGLDMPFFGHLVNMWHTPILLARRSGAAVLLTHALRQPSGEFRIFIQPPLDIPQTEDREADVQIGCQRMFAGLESLIRDHATQYLWQYDLFRDAPRLP
jgi:KDO2-lipid IV(A) lauroyltransferase